MKMNKYVSTKRSLLYALCLLLIGCVFFGYAVIGNNKAEAYKTSTPSVSALYDFDQYCYSKSSLDSLAVQLIGSGKRFDDLVTYAKNAGTSGLPVNNSNGSITTVSYGRYRFSTQSIYKPLIWLPVYISKSSSGDAILTLYLAGSEKANNASSQQEALEFSNSGTYSTDYTCTAPSNSYSTSHMRSISLGNVKNAAGDFVGDYAFYDASHSSYVKLYNTGVVNENNCNKFSDFINGTNFTGLLYEDIATPAEMVWQGNQVSRNYLRSGSSYATYNWPNEAYLPTTSGSFSDNAFDYFNANKMYYDRWKDDKVWLPSLTEVGTGDNGISVQDTTDGIWKLNKAQRSNEVKSWLRSANTVENKGSGYSTYTMWATDEDGSITTADVNQKCGIRPAIHLNLSRITSKTTPPVNLPETVKSVYNGEVQTIDPTKNSWYYPEDMNISFFIDKECTIPVAPINAGTYYMMVELKISSDRYFLGEDRGQRLKSTKFVVEKIKLGVKWTYDPDVDSLPAPIKVEIDGEFLQRDIDAGNIPKVGMKHSNTSNAGIVDSVEFPDKVGYYTATAYIVEEELHNYNYELSGTSLTSHQYFVGQTKVPEPYFLASEGTDKTRYEVGYKGRQWVQIANVSKYIDIDITISKTKGQNTTEQAASAIEAREKMVDLGVSSIRIGDEDVLVHTYEFVDIGEYTFTVSLQDKINTIWESSSEGGDDSDKSLVMMVNQAYLTVTFEGLPSSWESAREVAFDINVLGIYDSSESVTLEVYYAPYGNDAARTPIRQNSSGKYVIPSDACSPGQYNVYAMLSGTSSYTSNYRMKAAVYQKFTVTRTEPKFTPADANWIYRTSDNPSVPMPSGETIAFNKHNSANDPYELDYTGNYYSFSLSIPQSTLQTARYYVRADYTGDTYVKEAGLHQVTVTITAYDKNIQFTPQVYTIYFNISKAKYDLSGLTWNAPPFIYSGNENRVYINPNTLPAGLLVDYETDGEATNAKIGAGTYTTKAIFRVSEEFAANYMVPVEGNESSYRAIGEFSFTQEWTISKMQITARWTDVPSGGTGFVIPSLEMGRNFVDYTYEHKVGDSWEACTTIAAQSGAETYKVTAALKDEYAVNYELSGTLYKEFTVQPGQYGVSVHFEIGGKTVENEEQFSYTGGAIAVTAVLDSTDVTMTAGTVSYYVNNSGTKGASVGSAMNVGKYIAEIPLTFTSGDSVNFSETVQYYFEIIKANIDISGLEWFYSGSDHGGNDVVATYNTDLQKWLDKSGNEVSFEFAYDNIDHVIDLQGSAAGITTYTVSGDKSKKIVGNYTASVSFIYDNNNYNAPKFPATLSWKVTKAKVDFKNVRWGYIDNDGNEHEFDFKNNSFTFTRVEGQDAPVKFRVGLINLPAAVKDLVRYTTTSYTDREFGTKIDNAFSAIGEYCTTFEVPNTNTNPNYEFTNADVPANLARTQDWQIVERMLTKPYYDGSWTHFDNVTHDLIDLSGMPRNELCYFSVDITFRDTTNGIHNNYLGYKDSFTTDDYYAKLAGTYIIRFNELRGDNADPYIWGTVEIVVEKEELEVTWDMNGSIPVARVTGIYVSNMLGTRYTNTSGGEVTEAYIHTTDGVTFYAEPYITDEEPDYYAKNITFVMAEGQIEKREFISSQFHSTTSTEKLYKPVLENDTLEFNGKAQTFVIANWSTYSYFLYISDGGLTQTNIGEYTVKLSFKKEADAYWRDTGEDRSDYVLTYRIVRAKRTPIDYPVFKVDSINYNKGDAVTFEVTNWLVFSEYLYEVNNSLDDEGRVVQRDAGTYVLTFRFKTDIDYQGYWKANGLQDDYELTYTIIDPEKMVANPAVEGGLSRPYTGSEIKFVISNWGNISDYVEITDYDTNKVKVTGGVISITEVGVYELTVNINTDSRTFPNGTTSYTLKLVVTGSAQGLPRPEFVNSRIDFEGDPVTFELKNWAELYADYLDITVPEGVTVSGGKLTVDKAGRYDVVIKFKDETGKWQGGNGDPITLTFYAQDSDHPAPPELVKLPEPVSLEYTKREFTGYEITFAVKNWEELSKYVTVKEGSLTQTEIGKYSVILSIDATRATWYDGSTGDITFEFEITKATLTLGTGEDGEPTAVNGDGEAVDILSFLDPTYYDADGNVIEEKDLKDGEQYIVKYSLKDEENFANHFTNSEDVKNTVTNNTYNVIYHKPKGINWILIICIAAVVVLLILIIVTIVVIKKRRARDDEYYDDYDEEYDDYEDYDEYDDYDEDYDDYDDYYDE